MTVPATLVGDARMVYAVGAVVQAEARVAEMLLLLERTIRGLPLVPTNGDAPDRRTSRALVDGVRSAFANQKRHVQTAEAARPLLAAVKTAVNERNEAAHRAWYEDEASGDFTNTWEFFVRASHGAQRTYAPEDFLPLVERFELQLRGLGHVRYLVYDDLEPMAARMRAAHLRQLATVIAEEAELPRL